MIYIRLSEFFGYLRSHPRLAFVIAMLFLALLTVLSNYYLYYRFSIYEESGGWGRTLDSGMPVFGELIFPAVTYLPALVLVLFPRSWYWESILIVTFILFLFLVLIVEFYLNNVVLNKNSADVYFISMVGRLMLSFLFVGFLLLMSGYKKLLKVFNSIRN